MRKSIISIFITALFPIILAGNNAAAQENNPNFEPKCADVFYAKSCWIPVKDQPNCWHWNPFPKENEVFTWSETCRKNRIHGRGKVVWSYTDEEGEKTQIWEGVYLYGIRTGRFKIRMSDGTTEERHY